MMNMELSSGSCSKTITRVVRDSDLLNRVLWLTKIQWSLVFSGGKCAFWLATPLFIYSFIYFTGLHPINMTWLVPTNDRHDSSMSLWLLELSQLLPNTFIIYNIHIFFHYLCFWSSVCKCSQIKVEESQTRDDASRNQSSRGCLKGLFIQITKIYCMYMFFHLWYWGR